MRYVDHLDLMFARLGADADHYPIAFRVPFPSGTANHPMGPVMFGGVDATLLSDPGDEDDGRRGRGAPAELAPPPWVPRGPFDHGAEDCC
jgi:hypothetical protein